MAPPQTTRTAIRNQSGAFDLPSVLIGVAVVAILAVGVMATIFGAVPWAQNRAAAQDLAALTTAQGTAKARDDTYAGPDLMGQLGYLGGENGLDYAVSEDGSCWVGVTQAKSGKRFYTVNGSAPAELTRDTEPECLGAVRYDDISVAPGGACGISRGELYCWGRNSSGELGDGSKEMSPVPVKAGGELAGKTVAQVYASGNHRCAVDDGGTLYCWGANGSGEVGDGSGGLKYSPVRVGGALSGKKVTSVAVGNITTCAVTGKRLYCWGAGLGESEQTLGDARRTARSNLPVLVDGGALQDVDVVSVTTGANHACALSVDGGSYCWGLGVDGQMGNGTSRTSNPVPVATDLTGVSGGAFRSVAAGGNTTCGIAGGKVYCWGFGRQGQTGAGELYSQPRPTELGGALEGRTLTKLTMRNGQSCAGDDAGNWYCWGRNESGNLGTGNRLPVLYPAPLTRSGPLAKANPAVLSVGTYVTCALVEGRAHCAGINTEGNLGNGTYTDSATFSTVLEPADRTGKWTLVVLNGGKLADARH